MKIVYRGGEGLYEEKKSRFIATVKPVHSEEEAQDFIASLKKQYWDARHNCSAFVIGDTNPLTRCSDDGEPAGTAGRPMLDVLLREDIHNVAVVVTRYFGGVLLGTGGLVRAYQKSTQDGLAHAMIVDRLKGCHLSVGTDYNDLGKLEYLLREKKVIVANVAYEADVTMDVLVPEERKQEIYDAIVDQTAGRAKLDWTKDQYYAESEEGLILFEE